MYMIKRSLIILALLCAAILLPFITGLYPTVRFPREFIDVHVYPDHVRVEALYVYKNPFPFPVIQGFHYPLPVDDKHPMPEDVYAEVLGPDARVIPVKHIYGRHLFEAYFHGSEESTVLVTYDQPSLDRTGTYIITSTKEWKRPLDYALYRIFSHGVRITSCNYALMKHKEGYQYFERNDFMPRENWHFTWEPAAIPRGGGI